MLTEKSLQFQLRSFFTEITMARGEQYFLSQALRRFEYKNKIATAYVLGKSFYQVKIDFSKPDQTLRLAAECNCPAFDKRNFCKHLWCLILKMDEQEINPNIEWGQASAPVPANKVKSGIQTAPMQTRDWRELQKNVSAAQSSSKKLRPGLQPILILEQHPFDASLLRFHFFSLDESQKNPLLRPLMMPARGELNVQDTQLKSSIETINMLSGSSTERMAQRFSYQRQNLFFRDIPASALSLILEPLLSTRKIFISKAAALKPDAFLKFCQLDQFQLKVQEKPSGGYSVSAVVSLEQEISFKEFSLFAEPNFYVCGNICGFMQKELEENSWVKELSEGDFDVSAADTEAFLEALVSQNLPFALPPALDWQKQTLTPTLHLNLRSDSRSPTRFIVEAEFKYGTKSVPADSLQTMIADAENKNFIVRDTTEEKRLIDLIQANLLPDPKELDQFFLLKRDLRIFVEFVFGFGISLTIERQKIQNEIDFKINVSSGLDWFDVEAQVQFSDRWVKIPEILRAIKKGETFVPLPDGSMGYLEKKTIDRLEKLALFADANKNGLRFSQSQSILLNSILDSESGIQMDKKFSDIRERIQTFDGIKKAEASKDFVGKLRSYQKEGLGWLQFLHSFGLGGILADDMGLGKTIQCLAFLDQRRLQKKNLTTLIVAPKSLLENWQSEALKFTPELKVLIHSGLGRKKTTESFAKSNIVVTTYQTMLRDFEFLKEIEWDCLILDEAQAIKNPQALIAKAAKALSAEFKLALTGTPIENSIQDLFSISDFANPGFLNGRNSSANLKIDQETLGMLTRAFKPIILRRTKTQVLKDLPEKVEQTIFVELEPKQMKIYNDLKKFYQSQLMTEIKTVGIQKSRIKILAALLRLRQAALHPGLIDPQFSDSESAKFNILFEMLTEIIAEGNRILIFSQFTSLLSLLKVELKRRKINFCYLDGKTKNRQEVIADYKNNQSPIFLLSLKAGGVGLNLTEANYVFLLDPWWNPAVEAQAIDRVHRIGQKNGVNAYRLVAKNTVEEKIIELQKAKKNLSEDVLGNSDNLVRNLSASDIENIFS